MNNCLALGPVMLSLALFGCTPPVHASADPQATADAPRLRSLSELGAESTARSLPIKGWKTLNGTKVLFIRTTELPMFDVHVSFAAGSVKDLEQPGLAGATFSLLNEGIPGKDIAAFYEDLEGLGAQLDMNFDQERASFTLRSLSDAAKRTQTLKLFYQLMGEPAFSDEALVRVRKEMHDKLESLKQEPEDLANLRMKTLLPTDSRYAHPVHGTAEGLDALTLDSVQQFYRQAYVASDTQITLVGDLTQEQANDISLRISNALPNPPPSPEVSTARGESSAATDLHSHIERSQEQTYMLLAQYSVSREHADYPALHAAGLIFAGSTSSRLMTELREKHGVVYDVKMDTTHRAGRGMTRLALETAPRFSQATLALVQSMLDDYVREGPTQQELDRLKSSLTSRSALAVAGNGKIRELLSRINRYNLPLDLSYSHQQLAKLTLAEIKAALGRHLPAEQWRVVTVGPTHEQQPLPQPARPSADSADLSSCRADAGFVAS